MPRLQRIAITIGLVWLSGTSARAQITVEPVGMYAGSGAEISAYDPATKRLFAVNPTDDTLDILDLSDPTRPRLLGAIELGGNPNSVAAHGGVIAVAVENVERTEPGTVIFFGTDGEALSAVVVGALPDMLTFTPNGRTVLVVNEGEPNDSYTVDPEGSVSIIDVSRGAEHVTQEDVITATFSHFTRNTIRS